MSRLSTLVAFALVLFGLFFVGRSLTVQAAPSVSSVCGAISANTTWTANNSPYEVCPGGATVNSGITLTVQSGVTVQFLPTSKLTVVGKLLALGAPAQPITLTAVVTAQTP